MTTEKRDPPFNIRLDAEDRALLDAVAEHEKLSRSDIVRRAVREYATKLNVKVPKPKRQAERPGLRKEAEAIFGTERASKMRF